MKQLQKRYFNRTYRHLVDDKVLTPKGFAYFVGKDPATKDITVRTKKATDRGELVVYPQEAVLPATQMKLYYGQPVMTLHDGPGRVVDILYPRQQFVGADYMAARKHTKLPKPVKTLGDFHYYGTHTYFVWRPDTPTQVHWYASYQLIYEEGCPPLPKEFDAFFEQLGDPARGLFGSEPEEDEPEPEEDEPDNLNDLAVPGLSQGTPIL